MTLRNLFLSAAIVVGTSSISFSASANDPLIAETMTFGGNFCPRGWAHMDGTLLPISSNTALFSIIGTTFGGDGRTTFGLPDARGRSIVGLGRGTGLIDTIQWGELGGSESFVLSTLEMPRHTHRAGIRTVRSTANSTTPAGNSFANATSNTYANVEPRGNFMLENSLLIDDAGENQPVFKRSPYLGMTQCIALIGIFPSRN